MRSMMSRMKSTMSRVKTTQPVLESDSDDGGEGSDVVSELSIDLHPHEGNRLRRHRVSFSLGPPPLASCPNGSSSAHYGTERRDSLPGSSPAGLAVEMLQN
eukprot:6467982-Amphidinium_carterae.1